MTSGEFFVNAVLGTINNYIIHAGATQSTADLLAGVQKFDKGYAVLYLDTFEIMEYSSDSELPFDNSTKRKY